MWRSLLIFCVASSAVSISLNYEPYTNYVQSSNGGLVNNLPYSLYDNNMNGVLYPNFNYYPRPQDSDICLSKDIVLQIWNILANLLGQNQQLPPNPDVDKLKYIVLLLKKYLQQVPPNSHSNDIYNKLRNLENELVRNRYLPNGNRQLNGLFTALPKDYAKITLQYQVPTNIHPSCRDALLKLIKSAQEAYNNLLNNPLCGNSNSAYTNNANLPFTQQQPSYTLNPGHFVSNPQVGLQPSYLYPTQNNIYPGRSGTNTNPDNDLKNILQNLLSNSENPNDNILKIFQNLPQSNNRLYNTSPLNRNKVYNLLSQLTTSNRVLIEPTPTNLVYSLPQSPNQQQPENNAAEVQYPSSSPRDIVQPELAALPLQGNFLTTLEHIRNITNDLNAQNEHLHPYQTFVDNHPTPPSNLAPNYPSPQPIVNNAPPPKYISDQLNIVEIQNHNDEIPENLPTSVNPNTSNNPNPQQSNELNNLIVDLVKRLNNQQNSPQNNVPTQQLSDNNQIVQHPQEDLHEFNIVEKYQQQNVPFQHQNTQFQNPLVTNSNNNQFPTTDGNAYDLQSEQSASNPLKLDSAVNKDGLIELTYILKRPQPVYQPYSFVKYKIPYNVYAEKVKELLNQNPELRSKPVELHHALISKSNATEMSPELLDIPQDTIPELVVRHGSLVKAIVSNNEAKDYTRASSNNTRPNLDEVKNAANSRNANIVRSASYSYSSNVGAGNGLPEYYYPRYLQPASQLTTINQGLPLAIPYETYSNALNQHQPDLNNQYDLANQAAIANQAALASQLANSNRYLGQGAQSYPSTLLSQAAVTNPSTLLTPATLFNQGSYAGQSQAALLSQAAIANQAALANRILTHRAALANQANLVNRNLQIRNNRLIYG